MVHLLASQIHEEFQPTAVVGVAHGGVFVGAALARIFRREFYPVRVSQRSRDKGTRHAPRILRQMPRELKGQRVLVVDDVASSGDTFELAKALVEKAGGKEVRTACLIRREEGYHPSFSALVTDEFTVFPWDYEPVTEDARFDVDPDKAGA
jgi:hypoxanthine phosphoribosyltransferase